MSFVCHLNAYAKQTNQQTTAFCVFSALNIIFENAYTFTLNVSFYLTKNSHTIFTLNFITRIPFFTYIIYMYNIYVEQRMCKCVRPSLFYCDNIHNITFQCVAATKWMVLCGLSHFTSTHPHISGYNYYTHLWIIWHGFSYLLCYKS